MQDFSPSLENISSGDDMFNEREFRIALAELGKTQRQVTKEIDIGELAIFKLIYFLTIVNKKMLFIVFYLLNCVDMLRCIVYYLNRKYDSSYRKEDYYAAKP